MYLLRILKERNITKNKLAKEAKITPQDLYNAFNGNKPFYPAWRKKIAKYLKVDEKTLFEEEGES